MHFSKKWLWIVTVLVMVFIVSACSEKSKSGSSNQSSGDDEKGLSHVSFTMASVQGIEGFDYTAGDGLAKYYSDKFNYSMEVTALNWDNWNERLRIWINSGDMQDIAVYNYIHADAATYVDQGLIKKFPDDWKTRWPNVAAVYEKTTLGPKIEEMFGGTYFIPRARFMDNLPGDPLANHQSLYLRKDWAEAVGFPIKPSYTTSEIIEFGKLIKEKDPGAVGDRLIPLAENTNHAVELFIARNSTYWNSFYQDKNGEYQWGGASDDTLKGLKLFQEAYNAGVLSPEFYTVQNEEHDQQFRITGHAGAVFTQAPTSNLQTVFNEFQANIGDPYENIHMATVVGEDGHFHQRDLINFWGTIIFNPDISDEKFERYMDVLDYNATREGYVITNMGLPEEDWTYGNDDEIVSLYDEKTEGKPLAGTDGKYPSWGYLLGSTILFDDFAFDNPNTDERIRKISKQLYEDRTKLGTPETFPKMDWTIYTHDSPSMKRAQLDYVTEYANLVTKSGDLEKNWNDWVQSNMSLIQPVLDELNAK
ncbi:ABC transporter substrate-binding protein [Lederbergia wuyishanensis]|uniref:Aldouronate transport system substrate-binding protein n=1 Tax=Lederbergia wuyishanensis TaxID=1347903 RepID=A0ABU0DA21_9BACI|nr:ABC transporter substrate-binding protein [Lederbergia wuyishanensis]MCJ8008433.1 ABC transporter substrate-binding protein [Lederbergia wuyishanensis]MDQ0345176.1 putative aldouronate transport system substrate-binding protein [Lederbergia wuyishanensis]